MPEWVKLHEQYENAPEHKRAVVDDCWKAIRDTLLWHKLQIDGGDCAEELIAALYKYTSKLPSKTEG